MSTSQSNSPPRRMIAGERIAWVLTILIVQLGYIPLNRLAQGGFAFKTPLDAFIPLVPVWAYPYLISLPLWLIGYLWAAWRMEDRLFRALALASLGVMLASYVIFIVMPTYVERPTDFGTGLGSDLIAQIYSSDRAYNAFPSGHTYTTMLLALFYSLWKPRWRPMLIIAAAIILLSTLFTRQHYLPDLIGGIALAYAGYKLGIAASDRWPPEGLLANKRATRIMWIAAMVLCVFGVVSLMVIYAFLPVDGASGDLSSFSDLGFEVDAVTEVRQDGLRAEDIITRAGGHTVEEWILGAAPGPEWNGGLSVLYEIIRRGEPTALQLTLAPLSTSAFLAHWWPQLIIIGLLFLLGLFLAVRRPDDPAARLMALLCFAIMLELGADGYNFQYPILVWRPVFWLHFAIEHISFTLMFATIFHFELVFPLPNPLLQRWPRLIPMLGYALMPLMIIGAMAASPTWASALDAGNKISFVAAMILAFGGLFAFARNLRMARTPVERAQIRWILWAAGVATAIGGPGYAVPQLTLGQPFIPLEFISLTALLLPTVAAIAILRYRLFNIDFLINRTIVYGALTVLLAAVFGGMLFGVQEVIRQVTGQPEPSLLAIIPSALVALLLFQPARVRLRRFVDRRLYGIKVEYHRRLPVQYTDGRLVGEELGPYEIRDMIGRGGMAEVYRGFQPSLGRDVAVKILSAKHADNEDFRRGFDLEAKTVAGLRHPNIVQLFDYGEFNGVYYMVMELLTGSTLKDRLAKDEAMPVAVALPMLVDIAKALDYAHSQKIIHRDVKPGNIVLHNVSSSDSSPSPHVERGPGGEASRETAILTDFGIARIMTATPEREEEGLVGTLEYIAPEQITQSPTLDGRADQYALGVVAYQMLTGRLPFHAELPGQLVMAHLFEPAADLRSYKPDLSPDVSFAVLRALEKEPKLRYSSVGAFAAALRSTREFVSLS